MKAVFVVCAVAVLLCGCNAARFRERKDSPIKNNRALREQATQILKVKPLPCSFGVKYEDIASTDVYKGEYKFYNFSEIYVEQNMADEKIVYTTIKRADIPDGDDPDTVYVVDAEDDGDSCSVTYLDSMNVRDSVFYLSDYISPGFLYCAEVKETTWEGKKCTNCSLDNDLYFIEDGYVIGYRDPYFNRTFKFEYKFDDFRDDIVLKKDCKYDSVPEGFYSAPSKVEDCKAKILSAGLKKLPCTFGVKYNVTNTANGVFKRYGKSYLDAYELVSMLGITHTYLVRADIHDPSEPETVLIVASSADVSSCYVGDSAYIRPSVEMFSEVDRLFFEFGLYDGELYCEKIEDVTFDDKKCKSCALLDSENKRIFLFVKDGLVIGATFSVDSTWKLEYEFEDFRSDLALKCEHSSSIPEEVYSEPPKEEDCGHKPKGDDVASSLSVAASMIICMLMITLISLF